jgi:lipopolysaccharide export system ATP-binding protein
MSYFEVSKVNKFYNKILVLSEVNFSLDQGQMIWVSGDNGSGKTTLCKIISGMLAADNGSILLQDEDIKKMPAHKRMHDFLAYMPQESILLYDYNVDQNLKFTIELLGDRIFSWSEKLLEIMNALFKKDEFASQNTVNLSRGERRKLEFYITLLANSEIYLFDEPFSGLDANSKMLMVKTLELLKMESKTIILIEHDIPKELSKIIDQKVVL